MADKITTLHPENDTSINLYPNVKDENIPNTIARVSYVDQGDNENDLAISAVRADLDTEISDRKKDTADTNGRIDGLATDISILETRITGLRDVVTGVNNELQEEITNRETADTALSNRITTNESDIQYLYRQVIGGGDLVTATDSGVSLTSQTFPLTISPKALLNYVGGMCQKLNQLVIDGNFAVGAGWGATYGTKSISNNVCTYEVTTVGDYGQNRIQRSNQQGFYSVANHKYLTVSTVKPLTRNYNFYFRAYGTDISFDAYLGLVLQGTKTTISKISTAARTEQCDVRLGFGSDSKAIGDKIEVYQVALIDLTAIYGAGNEPTSTSDPRVQWLISYLTEHPEYNAGTILTAPVTKVVSKNANGSAVKNYPIPAEVQALDGYGLGIDDTTYNYIDFERKKFVKKVSMTGNELLKLPTPVETDISEYLDRDLPDGDVIDVTAGGYLEFENENNMGVPYSVTYQSKPETQGE